MAISRKNNDAPKGVNLDRLQPLVERIEAKKSASDDARSDLGTIYKEAEDYGYNRPALKLAIKLRNMEPDKRSDFLSSLNAYCDKLGIFAQPDLFKDKPMGVGPETETTPNVANLQGKKAGKRGDDIKKNPHPDGSLAHAEFAAGWIEGQAEKIRSTIKPDTETHASA